MLHISYSRVRQFSDKTSQQVILSLMRYLQSACMAVLRQNLTTSNIISYEISAICLLISWRTRLYYLPKLVLNKNDLHINMLNAFSYNNGWVIQREMFYINMLSTFSYNNGWVTKYTKRNISYKYAKCILLQYWVSYQIYKEKYFIKICLQYWTSYQTIQRKMLHINMLSTFSYNLGELPTYKKINIS